MSRIHECVWRWLQGCPHVRDLYFNFARAREGDTVLVPLTGAEDVELKRYIDGASERRYTFSLIRFDLVSDAPNDEANLWRLLDAEQIALWIRAQRERGAFPTLPAGCLPFDIQLPGEAGPALAPADGEQARYILQFSIDYLKMTADENKEE